jgi:ABC-type antimicrobial peptide transport system permease subunit
VQNTYLTIFGVLGGLGLALGCIGLGLVVLRNVLERRGELALMRSVGFARRSLRWLVLSEHWGLLGMGLGIGIIAALVAVAPALMSPGTEIPYGTLGWTLGVIAVSGVLWTALAAFAAFRGPLIEALRRE